MNGAQKLVASVLDCNKPVIAAVHGAATGLGAHVVYASDLVIATVNAYFAESFVKRGLVVDGGGCYLLPRRIGMQKAKEMTFFGEKLSATEAFTLGLVNRVVNPADFDATVADFAGRLAGAPTSAIAFTKRLLNDSPTPTGLAHSSRRRWRRRSSRIRTTPPKVFRRSWRNDRPNSPGGEGGPR